MCSVLLSITTLWIVHAHVADSEAAPHLWQSARGQIGSPTIFPRWVRPLNLQAVLLGPVIRLITLTDCSRRHAWIPAIDIQVQIGRPAREPAWPNRIGGRIA